MVTVGVIAGIVVVAVVAIMLAIKNILYICQPNEVLIFAGKSVRGADGKRVGYRIIKGGRGIRIPMMERVSRMDLTNMIIDLRVSSAYSKGGVPLAVEGVANMKIAGEEPIIHNAIERFLGKSRDEIMAIAKETLEGNLRGVLASLTPEQVNEDKVAFAHSLLDEASEDLNQLGLVLDTLQIQNIYDEVKYLDSIGRKKSAELQRDARVAEANAKAESVIKAAENQQATALARIDADIEIAKADANRRTVDALTRRKAVVAEEQSAIVAQVARRQGEVEVQKARIEQVRRKLQADVVTPAAAERMKAVANAKGDAATIVEQGRALVEGLQSLTQSWKDAGPQAKQIFMLQKMEILLKLLGGTVKDVNVDQVTFIDSGDGKNPAINLANFIKQLKGAAGVDLAGLVKSYAATRPKGDA